MGGPTLLRQYGRIAVKRANRVKINGKTGKSGKAGNPALSPNGKKIANRQICIKRLKKEWKSENGKTGKPVSSVKRPQAEHGTIGDYGKFVENGKAGKPVCAVKIGKNGKGGRSGKDC